MSMERLTKRLEDGQAAFHECHGTCGTCDGANCYCIGPMVDRLAAYEDTGLEPEQVLELKSFTQGGIHKVDDGWKHVQELLRAEQDGRLVVLPCKVGDSVYIPDLEKKIPIKVRVQGISISVSGRTILHFGGYPVECAWGDGCWKDWFLTREEAEAALAGKGSKNE